jgi:hypothetical protein
MNSRSDYPNEWLDDSDERQISTEELLIRIIDHLGLRRGDPATMSAADYEDLRRRVIAEMDRRGGRNVTSVTIHPDESVTIHPGEKITPA